MSPTTTYLPAPAEIEGHLVAHPAVLGRPDERMGEAVATVLRLRDGHDLDVEALRATMAERLSPSKLPSRFFVADALPATPPTPHDPGFAAAYGAAGSAPEPDGLLARLAAGPEFGRVITHDSRHPTSGASS